VTLPPCRAVFPVPPPPRVFSLSAGGKPFFVGWGMDWIRVVFVL
jgi:hypothetical protein